MDLFQNLHNWYIFEWSNLFLGDIGQITNVDRSITGYRQRDLFDVCFALLQDDRRTETDHCLVER